MTKLVYFRTSTANPEPHFLYEDRVYFAKDMKLSKEIEVDKRYYVPDNFIRCVKRNLFAHDDFSLVVVKDQGVDFLFPFYKKLPVNSIDAERFEILVAQHQEKNDPISLEEFEIKIDEVLADKGIVFDKGCGFKITKPLPEDKDSLVGPCELRLVVVHEKSIPYSFIITNGSIRFGDTGYYPVHGFMSYFENQPLVKDNPHVSSIYAPRTRTNRHPSLSGTAAAGKAKRRF